MKTLAAIITIVAISTPAHAARHASGCNVTMPCDFTYELTTRRAVRVNERHWHPIYHHKTPHQARLGAHRRVRVVEPAIPLIESVVAHPAGCPARAFCGCGAVQRLRTAWGVIFKQPRSLWLAANWPRMFHRASPAPGMVAARRHHVMVLERSLGGNLWVVYDANSGGHATRIHARSISGYTIVNPRT